MLKEDKTGIIVAEILKENKFILIEKTPDGFKMLRELKFYGVSSHSGDPLFELGAEIDEKAYRIKHDQGIPFVLLAANYVGKIEPVLK
jgi:hypothetical protein